MAKSTVPLLLAVGGAALLLSGKKRKAAPKTTPDTGPDDPGDDRPGQSWIDVSQFAPGGGSDEKAAFDAECSKIDNQLDFKKHDAWYTGRYFELVDQGMGVPQIALQLLVDQAPHCPWGDSDQWTPFMTEIFNYYAMAIENYARVTSGETPG